MEEEAAPAILTGVDDMAQAIAKRRTVGSGRRWLARH